MVVKWEKNKFLRCEVKFEAYNHFNMGAETTNPCLARTYPVSHLTRLLLMPPVAADEGYVSLRELGHWGPWKQFFYGLSTKEGNEIGRSVNTKVPRA